MTILKNRLCVVTGAARGIGFEIARSLLNEGARVVLSDVDATALEATVESLQSDRAHALSADVASKRSMEDLASQAKALGEGVIDVWVNNAGLARHRRIEAYTEKEIDLMLAVNLKGTILGSQQALISMGEVGRGHIVNIVSTASLRGIPTESVYCSAKWGVRGFTQALAEEAAPLGVKVTALLPGGVDTAFWQDAVENRTVNAQDFLTGTQVAQAVAALINTEATVVPRELVLRSLADRDFGSA